MATWRTIERAIAPHSHREQLAPPGHGRGSLELVRPVPFEPLGRLGCGEPLTDVRPELGGHLRRIASVRLESGRRSHLVTRDRGTSPRRRFPTGANRYTVVGACGVLKALAHCVG